MADIYLEVEDYLWFEEYQQGNVNVAGLVFDDLIEESLDLGHEAYVVWTDQIEETIDFSEAAKVVGVCDVCGEPAKHLANCEDPSCKTRLVVCGDHAREAQTCAEHTPTAVQQ